MFYRFVSYLETLLLKNCNIRNRHYIHVLLTLKVEVMNKMIRLSTKLKQERVKRSITQETLANYLNISKTTISKWENDLLYPDITMLPMLARFFNISVDELLNYNDSISNEEMKQLNGILNNTITDSSYEDYLNLAQIYFIDYSNEFEFLNNLLGILTNNIIYATDNPQYQESISLALEIIKTIEMNSSSIYLKKHAQGYKMILYMYQRDYGAVIEGVPDYDLKLGEQVLLATSYKQSGQLKKARSVLQTDMYQHLMNILYELMVLLMHEDLHVVPIEDFESKVKNLNKAFNIDYLFPYITANYYVVFAKYYSSISEEQCEFYLNKYIDCFEHLIVHFTYQKDEFFSDIDMWLEKMPLGNKLPQNYDSAIDLFYKQIIENEAFKKLSCSAEIFDELEKVYRKKNQKISADLK